MGKHLPPLTINSYRSLWDSPEIGEFGLTHAFKKREKDNFVKTFEIAPGIIFKMSEKKES